MITSFLVSIVVLKIDGKPRELQPDGVEGGINI